MRRSVRSSSHLILTESLEQRRMFAVTPTVHVIALGSATGAEYRSQPASFAINRTGSTSRALTVHYRLGGTATNGSDYAALTGTAVIPAGRSYTTVAAVPLHDALWEGNETVTVALVAGTGYAVAPGEAPTLTIIDYPINTDWRAAPFARHGYVSTIYVNQFGGASLPGQALGAFNGYGVFYDDGGAATFTATGTVPTDVAYYEDIGQPGVVNRNGASANTTSVTGTVSPEKGMNYVGVRPHNAGATGTFDLTVTGPAEGVPYDLDVSSVTNAGSSGSDISGVNDYDFYKFTVPRNGNWLIQAVPTTGTLDISMNVYDAAGTPIGGTYTAPINNVGAGHTENFTAVGLRAGTKYYLRVDGVGDDPGDYGVAVQIAPDLPDVSVSATNPRSGRNGKFTVVRSDNSSTPLTLHYRVRGSAVAGTDYQALSGVITIPANASSATIDVTALRAAAGKSIVLSLYAGADFNLTGRDSATLTLV